MSSYFYLVPFYGVEALQVMCLYFSVMFPYRRLALLDTLFPFCRMFAELPRPRLTLFMLRAEPLLQAELYSTRMRSPVAYLCTSPALSAGGRISRLLSVLIQTTPPKVLCPHPLCTCVRVLSEVHRGVE